MARRPGKLADYYNADGSRSALHPWRFRKTEFKREVLARLQSASWMVDAGWSPDQIAAHYQNDRDQRAAVKVLRRRGEEPDMAAVQAYRRANG